jgi:hypothetical protein
MHAEEKKGGAEYKAPDLAAWKTEIHAQYPVLQVARRRARRWVREPGLAGGQAVAV